MTLANSDILAAALACVRRGWSVIPVRPGTKVAAIKWSEFQKRRPEQAQVEEWFGNVSGFELALVLGEVSGGLVCRDFDGAAGYQAWATAFPDLAKTLPTVATSRGRHVYFRANLLKSQECTDGEYRGAGNYVLIPPSLHPSGVRYTWVVPLPAGDVPLVDPVKSGLLPEAPVPLRAFQPHQNKVAQPRQAAIRLTQRTQRFLRIGAADGRRNSELFCAACDMAARCIPRHEAERQLLDACAKCQPPYPPDEALATIASAYSRPRRAARER